MSDLKGKLKDFAKTVGSEAGSVLQVGKEKAYGLAAKVEHKVQNKEGIIGGLADLTQAVGEYAGVIGREIRDKGARIHADVQEKGGYKAVAQSLSERAITQLDKTLGALEEKIDSIYSSFEDRLFTGGEYDAQKAKQLVKDAANTTGKFGAKAYVTLSELTKKGAETVKQDYRKLIPSKEERATIYAGIGSKYKGVLFRSHFEECLTFYAEAEKILPTQLRGVRTQMLDDLKASASANPQELKAFYKSEPMNLPMLQKVEKYFK